MFLPFDTTRHTQNVESQTLNPELQNPQIEAFVLVASPENSVTLQADAADYYRPLLTPFELEIGRHLHYDSTLIKMTTVNLLDLKTYRLTPKSTA
jgi:diphthamide synthase subunit DPH2